MSQDAGPPPEQRRVVIAGLGLAGFSGADALLRRGGRVAIVDDRDGDSQTEHGRVLELLGAEVRLGGAPELPDGDVLVVSTGIPLNSRWIAAARDRGMEHGVSSNWRGGCDRRWILRRGSTSPEPMARRPPL